MLHRKCSVSHLPSISAALQLRELSTYPVPTLATDSSSSWSIAQLNFWVAAAMLGLPITCLGNLTLMQHSRWYNTVSHIGSRYVDHVRPPVARPLHNPAAFLCSNGFGVNPALVIAHWLLLVQRVILDMHHCPEVSCNVPQCLSKLLPRPFGTREKSLLFFNKDAPSSSDQSVATAASMLWLLWFTNLQ